jgi:UDP-glucose 4-epimerase
MKKVLIIGGGFIGSNFASFLFNKKKKFLIISQKKKNNTIKRLNYTEKNFFQIIKKEKFTDIFFLSGAPNPNFCKKNKKLSTQLTITNLVNLLRTLKKFKFKGYFYLISSAAVYGLKGKTCRESLNCKPISLYGKLKYSAEKIAFYYSKKFNLNIAILRVFSAFGEDLRRQVIFDIYKKFKNDTEVRLLGTGNESRDFIYINDICAIFYSIMNNKKKLNKFNIFNIATGYSTKIKHLAYKIKKILKINKNIIFSNKMRSFDVKSWKANVKKIKKLNINNNFKINTNLKRTINYWNNNY